MMIKKYIINFKKYENYDINHGPSFHRALLFSQELTFVTRVLLLEKLLPCTGWFKPCLWSD